MSAQTDIIECPITKACVPPAPGSPPNATITCLSGHTGTLCAVCEEGWASPGGSTQCRECWAPGASLAATMGLALLVLLLVVVIIARSSAERSTMAGMSRVLVNYLQVCGV